MITNLYQYYDNFYMSRMITNLYQSLLTMSLMITNLYQSYDN